MSGMDVNQVLAQMRTMAAQAGKEVNQSENKSDFAELLTQSIDKVNATQMEAGSFVNGFETGTSDANLSEVMVSIQKASVSFQAMVQVRNKLVEAYNDVMNMPM